MVVIHSATSHIICTHYYRPKRSFGQGYVFTGVCDSVHGGGGALDFALIWGGAPDFALIILLGGSSKFPGGVFFLGGVFLGGFLQIFLGGWVFLGGFLQILGGSFLGGVPPNFRGGSFFGGVPPNFRGGLHRNTVNVRPVRILLECILVLFGLGHYL